MNSERAKSIIQSHGVIDVRYEGAPVWLEQVRGDNAEISYLGTKNRVEVPVSKLVEVFGD